MILTLDVGNTNIHVGLFRGADLLDQWRVSTVSGATSDELGLILAQCLRALSPSQDFRAMHTDPRC